MKKIVKKIIGIGMVILFVEMILHPFITLGITITALMTFGQIIGVWILANLVSRIVLGKTIIKFLMDDEE